MSGDNTPDISGMVNDSQFLGLSPQEKRQALFSLTGDDSFNGLNDGETMQFVSRVASPRTALTRPDIVPPPSAPRPQVQMQEAMFAPSQAAMQPDKQLTSLSQSGEGYASDEGTSGAMSVAGGVTGAGLGAAALPAAIPPAIAGVKAVGAWAKANPVQAYILFNTLKEMVPGFKKAAGFIKGAPEGTP